MPVRRVQAARGQDGRAEGGEGRREEQLDEGDWADKQILGGADRVSFEQHKGDDNRGFENNVAQSDG